VLQVVISLLPQLVSAWWHSQAGFVSVANYLHSPSLAISMELGLLSTNICTSVIEKTLTGHAWVNAKPLGQRMEYPDWVTWLTSCGGGGGTPCMGAQPGLHGVREEFLNGIRRLHGMGWEKLDQENHSWQWLRFLTLELFIFPYLCYLVQIRSMPYLRDGYLSVIYDYGQTCLPITTGSYGDLTLAVSTLTLV
jgi:hypothetical protein